MKYLLTIYIDEKQEAAYTAADWKKLDEGYAVFDKAARAAGAMVEGHPLQAPSTAKTIRVRGGKVMLTDGPFAETKEQMGGFCILDCPSIEDVVTLARLMPGAISNCVEIREFAG